MSEVNIVVRTADQTRKAEVAVPGSQTGGDVMQAAIDNWSLPVDTDYSLLNTRNAQLIEAGKRLDAQDVRDGDVLEVQPVLVAGH